MDLLRPHPNLHGQATEHPDNRFAGSLFLLEIGTIYEIGLPLRDPQGGGTQQVETATTLNEMQAAVDAMEAYVVPGDQNCDGSAGVCSEEESPGDDTTPSILGDGPEPPSPTPDEEENNDSSGGWLFDREPPSRPKKA